MNLIVKKTSILKGEAFPPSSKSQSIRAIILASLCRGKSIITNALHSQDTKDAIHACRQLGADIIESANKLSIHGTGLPLIIDNPEIDCGNSGITTHFMMPLLGLRKNPDQPIVLNCSEQMRKRPLKPLMNVLTTLGLRIKHLENNDTLPIELTGALRGGKAQVDGSTSQYLSALLFALPFAPDDSEITVINLQERPYVDMTLNYLRNHHIAVDHVSKGEMDTYFIKGAQTFKNKDMTISCDFSSASYLIAASVFIPGEVILKGLNMADPQGDKQLITLLQEMGADMTIEGTQLSIRGGKALTGINIDAKDIPDLLPTLSVIGAYASGKTKIYNAAHARIKETDRIDSMANELSRMNAKITEQQDGLTIFKSELKGSHVKGYGDHRTVMALSLAGLIADGTTIIHDAEAIDKTFPSFVKTMQSLGAKMEIQHEINC